MLEAANEIGRVTEDLRQEVDHFLVAMRSDNVERRKWERIPGHATPVMVRVGGRAPQRATLIDISRAGVAIESDLALDAGVEVNLEFPGHTGIFPARVARRGPQACAPLSVRTRNCSRVSTG